VIIIPQCARPPCDTLPNFCDLPRSCASRCRAALVREQGATGRAQLALVAAAALQTLLARMQPARLDIM